MAEKKHPLHSMCSYLGCFPPSVPRKIIEEWVPEGALVLDPFCGSGTTLIEATNLGHPCIGIDLNPLAVALSSAKIQNVDVEDVNYRLQEIANSYRGRIDLEEVPESLGIFFHPRALSQLVYLREALDLSKPEDIFIRGALLGIMHGKFRKDGSTAYLSIDMPNTFSMSPAYVKRFVARHSLSRPAVDVFAKLRDRCHWLLREGSLKSSHKVHVMQGDAARLAPALQDAGIKQVDAIVTSPPYLGILRYGAFNWIRLWFLGYEPSYIDRSLDGTDSLDRYLSFMASFLMSAAEVLKPGSPVALVIGDVVEFGTHLNLAQRVWEDLGDLVPFEIAAIDLDQFDETSKTTRIWGEGKKGRATPLDRILVMERIACPKSNQARHKSPLKQANA